MDCPECKNKIGFVESLTIINPLKFKCKKCSNYLTLSMSSIKKYILLLVVIFTFSFIGFLLGEIENILTKSFLLILVPSILIVVTIIHFFFWENASAELKNPDKKDLTSLSC